jgi:hypothetical protein
MARNGGERNTKRLGKLVHRRLALRKPPKDRPPRRIRKRRKRGGKSVRHLYLTDNAINMKVK